MPDLPKLQQRARDILAKLEAPAPVTVALGVHQARTFLHELIQTPDPARALIRQAYIEGFAQGASAADIDWVDAGAMTQYADQYLREQFGE